MFGRNVDKAKVEVKVGVEDFLTKAFEKYYIVIWSCMKLEDVLKVLPMFMLENCMDRFVFLRDVNNVPRWLVKFHPSPIII
jgi:hypothetical protein